MTSGVINQWECREGCQVRRGETVLVVENEKTIFEVQSPADGILHIVVEADRETAVGQTVGVVAENEEEYARLLTEKRESEKAGGARDRDGFAGQIRAKASPLARKRAEELGIDLMDVTGSGPSGRIVEADVLRRQADQNTALCGEGGRGPVIRRIPVKGMRRAIARNLISSLTKTAQVTNWVELDVSNLVLLKEKLGCQQELLGATVTLTALIARILVKTIEEHPYLNGIMTDEEIRLYQSVNLSLAVSTDTGLRTPLIRNLEELTLVETSRAIKEAVGKAREDRLTVDDSAGGTISLTNLSKFQIDGGTPILSAPMVALFGIYRIVKKPVVVGDEMVIRPMMTVSLTYDHRAFDGVEACAAFDTIKQLVENPEMFLS